MFWKPFVRACCSQLRAAAGGTYPASKYPPPSHVPTYARRKPSHLQGSIDRPHRKKVQPRKHPRKDPVSVPRQARAGAGGPFVPGQSLVTRRRASAAHASIFERSSQGPGDRNWGTRWPRPRPISGLTHDRTAMKMAAASTRKAWARAAFRSIAPPSHARVRRQPVRVCGLLLRGVAGLGLE